MTRTIAAAFLLLLIAPSSAFAETVSAGDIRISGLWVREAPKTAKVGAGYLTIENTGSGDDALVGIDADFRRVMIHGTSNENGIMKMFHVHDLPIPAGAKVVLEPGGYHIMFMGIGKTGLRDGDTVEAVLEFERAGDVAVTFPVRSAK